MADSKSECVSCSCSLTISELRKNIALLRAEVLEKNNLIVEFSAVATTQAKHLAIMSTSSHGCTNSSLPCSPAAAAPDMVADLTIPWFGSATTGAPEPEAASALPEDPWLRLGVKPRTTAGTASSPVPAELQVFAGGEVEAPVSSTPCQTELWSVARRDKYRAVPPSLPSSQTAVPLSNRFDVLNKKDFPPLGKHAPRQPAKPSSARRKLLKQAAKTSCFAEELRRFKPRNSGTRCRWEGVHAGPTPIPGAAQSQTEVRLRQV